jgi:hypothetical protein
MFRPEWLLQRGAPQSQNLKEKDAVLFAGVNRNAAFSGTSFTVDQVNITALLGKQTDSGLVFIKFQRDAVGVGLSVLAASLIRRRG